jgi:hypothetical protein
MWKPGGVILVLLLVTPVSIAHAQGVSPERARAAFEALKQLAGQWNGNSTQGWEGTHTMEIIGGGSAIMSVSTIGPHPGADETMATMFHLDGDRLMVTHYCVAKNQPRLAATSISEDGRVIEFSFVDGTNMRSRDVGHMDRAVYTIESPDRYRSRWTFYQKGQERWMEDIVNTRRP